MKYEQSYYKHAVLINIIPLRWNLEVKLVDLKSK